MDLKKFASLEEDVINDVKPTTEEDLIGDRIKEVYHLGFRTKTAIYDKIKHERNFRDLVKSAKSKSPMFDIKAFVEKTLERLSK